MDVKELLSSSNQSLEDEADGPALLSMYKKGRWTRSAVKALISSSHALQIVGAEPEGSCTSAPSTVENLSSVTDPGEVCFQTPRVLNCLVTYGAVSTISVRLKTA
jgi:hypothetical protein